MSSSSRRRSRPQAAMVVLCWAVVCLGLVSSYSMQMTYKPPVKSSVKKLRNSRFGSSSDKQSSKQQASASYVGTPQDLVVGPSFEDRMRGVVFGKKKQAIRILPPNVIEVETLQQYKQVVGEETSRVVAVRFHAPWCKACKAVAPLFYHLANKFPNVVFVDVPVTDRNVNLHQGLGVTSLPFGHLYHPSGGLVEEVRLTRKEISQYARKLQTYVTGSCELQGVGDVSSPYRSEDDDDEA